MFASEEVKQIAIYQHYTLHYNAAQIASNLRMSRRTVERVLKLWQTTGEVVAEGSQKKQTRKKIMTEHERQVRPLTSLYHLLDFWICSILLSLSNHARTSTSMRFNYVYKKCSMSM